MTQTHPNISTVATDEQDNIFIYRYYSLQGYEIQATREINFIPIKWPEVHWKECRQVLTASSLESADPSPPTAWQFSSQSTPMTIPTRAKCQPLLLAKSPTQRAAIAATSDNPFPEQASMK